MKMAGVVLAGGRSSRMGRSKAMLDYRGRTLLEHMIGILNQAGLHDVYVSGDFAGYTCVPDTALYEGPACAIQNVLETLRFHEGILFVPVDMPLLNADILNLLMRQKNGGYFEGFPLPVFIKKGKNPKEHVASVRDLLESMSIDSIDMSRELKPCMLNINTPEEWKEVLLA